jgi:hypothetical protein
MTRQRRVRFDGSGQTGSPLRISVAGADALTAQFNNLIFDGNQPPLRLWGTGFTSVVGITFNERLGGKNVSEGSPIPVVAVPAGLTPVFMTHWRKDDGLGRLFTPSFQGSNNGLIGGGGGGICSGFFCAACFATGAPGAPDSLPPATFVNYCVFKNAN